MSKSTRGIRAAGIASLAVTLSLGVAAPAFAVEGFTLERIGGEDRYETAALVADEYSATNDNVILANGQPGFYADALAANYLAGVLDAPILLTNMKQIPEYTLDQLDEMNAQTVTVVGGEGVVPPEQVEQLEDAGYTVERVAGDDRFETNADVIAEGGQATDGIGLIATGFDFPDALAAGPFAYQGHPLGLSTADQVKDSVLDALEADGVDQVLIFGGESVVGQGVEDDLADRGITVLERFDGDDRSETSELAAEWALENLDFVDTHVGVASGYTEGYGADALAGGPLEGKEMSPMLITRNVDNPDDALSFIETHSDTLVDGHLFGGPGAVSVAAEAAMEEAGQGDAPASNQDFTVTPAGNQSNTTDSDDTKDNVSYTVSGIPATITTVDIALVPCENVTVTDSGVASFKDNENKAGTDTTVLEGDDKADDIDAADDDTPAKFITANGATVSGEYLNDVSVVNGAVSFSFDSAELECVRAVVFNDSNDDNALNLNADNQPTDEFSVTGEVTFTAPAAKTGDIGTTGAGDDDAGVNVVSNNEAADSFVGCDIVTDGAPGSETQDNTECATYNYDANDRFYKGTATIANQLTLAEFEAALSAGDDVAGQYNANPALVSEFILTDEAPTAPKSVDAERTAGAESTSVTVTWAQPDSGEPDSYNVYRTADTTSPVFPDDYTKVGTVDGDTLKFVDSGLTKSTQYTYAVTAVENGDESAAGTDTVTTAAENTTDTGRPFSQDAVVTTNSGLGGTFDTGDVFKVVFNEVMAAPNAGDTIRAQDNDTTPTVADFINGTNAAFTLNVTAETVNGVSRPAGTVLTVTLGGSPAIVAAGSSAGLQIPATVVDQSGNTDAAGNLWSLADSIDLLIDQDSVDNAPFAGAAPTYDSLAATAATNTATATFSEGILCSTVQSGDFTMTVEGTNAPITSVNCTPTADSTIELVTSTDVLAGDEVVVTLTSAGAVTDADGNPVTGQLSRTATAG